jgi:hypothetical protein
LKPLDDAQESNRVATFLFFQQFKKQTQYGHQKWIFHSLVNFYANHFKFGTSRKEKSFFSKLKNGGLIQDGVSNHCFILLALRQLFLNRF